MATSGVKEWRPLVSDLVEQAYLIAGLEPQLQLSTHNKTARTAINLMFSDWMTEFTPEWLKRQHFITIHEGQVRYDLATITEESDGSTVDFTGLDDIDSGVILETDNDNSVLETEMLTSKEFNELRINIIGRPYAYWMERRETPILHWTYTPQQDYRFRFIGVYRPDIVLTHSEHPDIPFRWHGAFVEGLAARLVKIFKPEDVTRVQTSMMEAKEKFYAAWQNEDDGIDLTIHNTTFVNMGAY